MEFVAILLTILKILGIVLGSIVGLVLILVLLVLFVPIRYDTYLDYSYNNDTYTLRFKAHYLLHMLSYRFETDEYRTKSKFRFFGIPIELDPNKREQKRRAKARKKARKRKNQRTVENKATQEKPLMVKEELNDMPKDEKVEVQFKQSKKSRKKQKEKKTISKKMKELYNKFIGFWKKLFQKIKDLLKTKDRLVKFFESKKNQEAFRLLKQCIGKLWKHILPKKYYFHIVFGLDDPCMTGQYVGKIYAVLCMMGIRSYIDPRFEEDILDFDLTAKGRIRIFTVLVVMIKLYKNKRIRKMIRQAMN